jgi:penicillin-binding protein 2
VMGSDVRLTLDIELQKDVQQLFEERSDNGAAVIIDVASGAVLAMVSVPTYDLNTYYQHDFYSVINDEDDPLHRKWNRALSVNYQPGSTIKPIVLLGALELDVVQALEQFNCHPRFKDWVGVPSDIHKHGLFDAADAIRQSCNFYFIKVGEKLGPQRMTDWLGRTGRDRRILAWPQAFSDRSIKGFGETLGHIKPIGATSLRTADLRFVAIGRGSLDGSLLQVANSTAAIARHGLYVAPTLIASPLVSQERIPIASQHYSRIVEKAMAEVVADSRGSGYEAFQPPLWEADDVRVYGKTGSTNYSLFTCYAKSQVSQQCIAVAVLVEVDLLGGEAAAPLARRILKKAAQHDYLPETLNYINGGG